MKAKILAILLTLGSGALLFAQNRTGFLSCEQDGTTSSCPLYTGNSPRTPFGGTFSASDFSRPEHVRYRVGRARIRLELTWQSDLDYVSLLEDKEIKVDFSIRFKGAGGASLLHVADKELVATGKEPEQVYIYNFHKIFEEVETVEVAAALSPETLGAGVDARVLQDLRIRARYEIDYHTDVRPEEGAAALGASADLATEVAEGSRRVRFKWIPEFEAPYYEFQLIRLDEVEQLDATGRVTGEVSFYTHIDWNKALTVEIHNYMSGEPHAGYKYLDLTLAEQGYYAWRVRPVGTYYGQGGAYAFGDARNFGAWSRHLEAGEGILVNPSLGDLPWLIRFEDPDKGLNYAYQRIMTEEGRLHESLSYADGLLRTRQNQTYLSGNEGERKVVFTQNIYDYTGRSSLRLLPVPLRADKLGGYRKDQVLNDNSRVYTADDFDKGGEDGQSSNYLAPGRVTGAAYDYYNNPEAAERVASTGGFPFARTIMINDGTERPLIQSGLGKEFALGSGNDNATRYFYSQPSDHELVMVFGEEALPRQAVLKVISRDPDGVTSVSYATNEGTTIATALVFKNTAEYEAYKKVNKLGDADLPDRNMNFEEKAPANDLSRTGEKVSMKSRNGEDLEYVLVSSASKEFAYTAGLSDLRIAYELTSKTEINIACDQFNYNNCEPAVRIFIRDENNRDVAILAPESNSYRISSGVVYTAMLNSEEEWTGGGESMTIQWMDGFEGLEEGKTYYAVKELYVRDQPDVRGTLTDRAEVLATIADVIGAWLSDATTPSAMVDFYASTHNFSLLLQGAIAANCDEGKPKVDVAPGQPDPHAFTIYGDERVYLDDIGSIRHYCASPGYAGSGAYIGLFPASGMTYTASDCGGEDYAPYLSLRAAEYCVLEDIGFYSGDGVVPVVLSATEPGGYASAARLKDEKSEASASFLPDVFKIKTRCCGEILLPVNGVPRPLCPDEWPEGDEDRAGEMLAVADRFVDYLQTSIIGYEEPEESSPVSWETLMPGYSPLTLKSMFFHMLYDRYPLAPGQPAREQYACPALWAGLQGAVVTYQDLKDQYDELKDGANLREPEGSDEETGNDKESQDEAIDENFGKSIMAWFIKTFVLKDKEMSSQVPERLELTLEYDFLGQFFNTVGYKYKTIVTSATDNPGMVARLEDHMPMESDYVSGAMAAFLTLWESQGRVMSDYFASFDAYGNSVAPGDPANRGYANAGLESLLYCNSPVYRFKYAEYGSVKRPGPEPRFATSALKSPRDLSVENAYCFLDYNGILDRDYSGGEFCSPVCQGMPDYRNWSSSRIKHFIKSLVASRDIAQSDPLDMEEQITEMSLSHKQEVLAEAVGLMDHCAASCEERRDFLRLSVMKVFDDNCYRIVDCADEMALDLVTETEIDRIVDRIVADCRETCEGLVIRSEPESLSGCVSVLGEVTSGDPRIPAGSAYPCIKPVGGCYTMPFEYVSGQAVDIRFERKDHMFRPYLISDAQRGVYDRLLGWEMEFALDPGQNRCDTVAEVPCWAPGSTVSCDGAYSAPVTVDMSGE